MVRSPRRRTAADDFESEEMSSIDVRRSADLPTESVQPPIQDQHYANKKANKSRFLELLKSKFLISVVIMSALFITLLCIGLVVSYEKEHDVTHSIDALREQLSSEQVEWFDSGLDELKAALQIKTNTRRAKNVILFVGDGMGPNTVTATRILKNGEGGLLEWEKFPHMGLLKTYSMDRQVPDSAAAATALFGGVKANAGTCGVDGGVPRSGCAASMDERHHVNSILKWAQDEGMSTGFVTTTRVMHATPAALFAHSPERRWECDATMPETAKKQGCKDLARQLIEDEPGRNFNVIMGGGRQCLQTNQTPLPGDPIDTWACYSVDGRHLMDDWAANKQSRGLRHAVVQNTQQLDDLDTDNTDYVLAIFANGHLPYQDEINNGSSNMPTIERMTGKAISVLSKNTKGFILVVEGGMIDMAHHRGWARRALEETAAMNTAVATTVNMMKSQADETLIIVTADHSHTLTINGNPPRGNDILGVAQNSAIDSVPYTTLTYGTGGPMAFQVDVNADGNTQRRDPSKENTKSYDYVQQATILTDENTHGGNDVTIHAVGPMAHLFHRVHEQSYVAHVISYAMRIGRFRDNAVVQSFTEILGL